MRLADTVLAAKAVVTTLLQQSTRVDRRPAFTIANNNRLSLQNRDRYIAQSILSYVVDQPPLPSAGEAVDIIKWASGSIVK